jgi:PIN domain nuclease of toxin-antitoxin system
MEVVLDSHTLFWLLTDSPKLSELAKRYIEKAEKVILPSITLMEILYLLEKNNLSFKFIEVLNEIRIRGYLVYPLDLEIISQSLFIPSEVEMHDRIIIATAKLFDAYLISKDREIKKVYSKTIW